MTIKKDTILYYLLLLKVSVLLMFLVSCASIVNPSGGPKDTAPPIVLKCSPLNYSHSMRNSSITIFTDEFVVLKEPSNLILYSPIINPKPEVTVNGKSIEIVFDKGTKLKDSTTYSILFDGSITDLHEGNALSSYKYVFSTGSYVDSFQYKGRVVDAYNLKPEKNVMVMLYDKNIDSIPLKEIPIYYTKTNETGDFLFTNLRKGKYKFFILKDANSNYIYDSPKEKIGFSDTLINAQMPTIVKKDTNKIKDTLKIIKTEPVENLYCLFQENKQPQKLLKTNKNLPNSVQFVFRYKVKSFSIKPINVELENNWKIVEYSTNRDTITCWMNNPAKDTIVAVVADDILTSDTVKLIIPKAETDKAPQRKRNVSRKLIVTTNIGGVELFDYFKNITIKTSSPVATIDKHKFILIENNDTIKPQIAFKDSTNRQLLVKNKLSENSKYKLIILPGAMTDIFGYKNDTIIHKTTTKTAKDYGSLQIKIDLTNKKSNYILQLLDDKDNILQTDYIDNTTTIKYENLEAKNYMLKLIEDPNKNKRWDEGNYLHKRQPEKVIYYPKIISTKPNWEIEESWIVK